MFLRAPGITAPQALKDIKIAFPVLGIAMSEPPYHLAIVPDGNRRWAEERGLSHREGHIEGAERAKDVVGWVEDMPVDKLTLWGLSKANADKRSEEELDYLNEIYVRYAEAAYNGEFETESEVEVNLKGDLDLLYEETKERLEELEEDKEGSDIVVNIALGYGGLHELAQAANRAYEEDGRIDEDLGNVKKYLQIPEVDIFMRYGDGVAHDSYFAPIQIGNSSKNYPQKNWPDAKKRDIKIAVGKELDRERTEGGDPSSFS